MVPNLKNIGREEDILKLITGVVDGVEKLYRSRRENLVKEPFNPETVRKSYYRSKETRNQRPVSLSESYQTAPLIDELGVQISILREGYLKNELKRDQLKIPEVDKKKKSKRWCRVKEKSLPTHNINDHTPWSDMYRANSPR